MDTPTHTPDAERPLKLNISIRLDKDVIDYFKAEGAGYQTRINEVLRAHIRANTFAPSGDAK
jgi:uncharacterized protein (DUF4415 family)